MSCGPGYPCLWDYSPGIGTGVAEAIGNWGFSNGVSSPGQELERLKCLFSKMDCLRGCKPMLQVQYDCRNDPQAWNVAPSPEACKPPWTFPVNRPVITYNSVCDIHLKSNYNEIKSEAAHYHPGRCIALQGTPKWYKRGPDCCPQPSCLAPSCPAACCSFPCCPTPCCN